MLTKDELPNCPVATTIQLIGNKWKLFIIQQLLNGPHRFTELLNNICGISKKVLTDNLRSMENDNIIVREIFAEVPPKVIYSLSNIGKSLLPIIDEMANWGNNYKNEL